MIKDWLLFTLWLIRARPSIITRTGDNQKKIGAMSLKRDVKMLRMNMIHENEHDTFIWDLKIIIIMIIIISMHENVSCMLFQMSKMQVKSIIYNYREQGNVKIGI